MELEDADLAEENEIPTWSYLYLGFGWLFLFDVQKVSQC